MILNLQVGVTVSCQNIIQNVTEIWANKSQLNKCSRDKRQTRAHRRNDRPVFRSPDLCSQEKWQTSVQITRLVFTGEVTDQCSHHKKDPVLTGDVTDQCSQEKWQTSAHITRQTLAHRRRDRPVFTGEMTDQCSHHKTDPSSQETWQTSVHRRSDRPVLTSQDRPRAHRRRDRPVFTSQDRP